MEPNGFTISQLLLIALTLAKVCCGQVTFESFKDAAETFHQYVTTEIRDHLGLNGTQDVVRSLRFANTTNDDLREKLKEITKDISRKMKDYLSVVQKLQDATNKKHSATNGGTNTKPLCCGYDSTTLLRGNENFSSDTLVDTENVCEIVSADAQNEVLSASPDIIEQMKENYSNNKAKSDIKWQFVGTEQGVLTIYPASPSIQNCSIDPRFRPWYIETSRPKIRHVIIILDMSRSMWESTYFGKRLFDISKNVIATLFKMLDPRDKIAFVGFNNTASRGPLCFKNGFVSATNKNKVMLIDYLRNAKPQGQSIFQKGFKESFKIISEVKEEDRKGLNLFMLISDGKPSEAYEELEEFYQFVETKQKAMNQTIKFFPVGLGQNVNKNIMERIAKYGGMHSNAVNATIQLKEVSHLRNWMSIFLKTNDNSPIVSLPYQDEGNLGLICTIGLPVYNSDHSGLKAVVATDVSIDSVFQKVNDFGNGDGSYAFVINHSGRVFLHNMLPKPSNKSEDPYLVNISQLECLDDDLVRNITSGSSGSKTIRFNQTRCSEKNPSTFENGATYYWEPITIGSDSSSKLVVVIKVPANLKPVQQLQVPEMWTYDLTVNNTDFVYHRLDIDRSKVTCKVFERRTTKNDSTVQFAADCFKDSQRYRIGKEDEETVEGFKSFFTRLSRVKSREDAEKILSDSQLRKVADPARLYAEKFKKTVIYDTMWTSIVNKEWKPLSETFAARLLGTESGIFRILPGGKVAKGYDVTKRAWYQSAKARPNTFVFSLPYNDAVGAGRIITISYALTNQMIVKNSKPKSSQVHGVLGIDLLLNQFRAKFNEKFPSCSNPNETYCALVDDEGNIVYENDYVSLKQLAIRHVLDYSDLSKQLYEGKFIESKLCLDHAKKLYKKSFKLKPNTALNYVNGTQCGQNMMYPINDTNVFVLMRKYYDFCNSIHCYDELGRDKECPNGSDLVSSGETRWFNCPCYKKIYNSTCTINIELSKMDIPPCVPTLPSIDPTFDCIPGDLEKCFSPNCNQFKDKQNCTSKSSHCTWCDRKDEDAFLPLKDTHCAATDTCYSGIKGQPLPGSDQVEECLSEGNLEIAWILVSVGILFVIALIVIYMYKRRRRQKRDETSESFSLDEPGISQDPEERSQTSPGTPKAYDKAKKTVNDRVKVMIVVYDNENNELFSKQIQVTSNKRKLETVHGSPSSEKKNRNKPGLSKFLKQKREVSRDDEDDEGSDRSARTVNEQRQRLRKKQLKQKESLRRRTFSDLCTDNGRRLSPCNPSESEEQGSSVEHRHTRSRLPATTDDPYACDSSPSTASTGGSRLTTDDSVTNYSHLSVVQPAAKFFPTTSASSTTAPATENRALNYAILDNRSLPPKRHQDNPEVDKKDVNLKLEPTSFHQDQQQPALNYARLDTSNNDSSV